MARKTQPHPLLAAFAAAGIADNRIARHYGVTARTVERWRRAEGIASTWKPERTATHGTVAMYDNHGCRCDSCRAANRASATRGRAERYAKTYENDGVAPVEVHNAYTAANWGCRCWTCREALREKNAAAYRRRNGGGES